MHISACLVLGFREDEKTAFVWAQERTYILSLEADNDDDAWGDEDVWDRAFAALSPYVPDKGQLFIDENGTKRRFFAANIRKITPFEITRNMQFWPPKLVSSYAHMFQTYEDFKQYSAGLTCGADKALNAKLSLSPVLMKPLSDEGAL